MLYSANRTSITLSNTILPDGVNEKNLFLLPPRSEVAPPILDLRYPFFSNLRMALWIAVTSGLR